MALRPIPNLDNTDAMAKLGRLSALRNARLDAISHMRDAFGKLQSDSAWRDGLEEMKEGLARLEEVKEMEG